MKKVLSALGQFFVRIGRWIKDTAWIQPLLIVGVIFAIIFSIPSIVDGINSINDRRNSAQEYYKKFQVTLKGSTNSPAQKLLDEIYANENGDSDTLDGQKFFLLFSQEGCSACESAREGFEKLSTYKKDALGGSNFSLKTIDVKQDTNEDWKEENSTATSAFEAFLDRNIIYFEGYASAAQNSNYYLNGEIDDATIEKIEGADISKFLTPTVLLVDFTATSPISNGGVTNVFINIKGDTSVQKAAFLSDAWLYANDFAA